MNLADQTAQEFMTRLRSRSPDLYQHIMAGRQTMGNAQATSTSPFWDTIRQGISTYAEVYAADKQRKAQAEQARIDAQNTLMQAEAELEEARIRAQTEALKRQFEREQAQIQQELNAFKNEKITETLLWAGALFGGFFWLRSQGVFK